MLLGEATSLPDDEIHVWVLELDRSSCNSQLLSHEEQERADRFVRENDRERFKVAHASLRQILGRYLNEAPLSLAFDANPAGKPFLAEPRCANRITFNLAHSEQYGLLAVTRHREVGIDIEVERNLDDLNDMARQIMSSPEFQAFRSTAPELASEIFFGLWTRKEAVLKAIGSGLSIDPRDLDLGIESCQAKVSLRGTSWSVAPLKELLPLKAAIAVDGDLPVVRIFGPECGPQSVVR